MTENEKLRALLADAAPCIDRAAAGCRTTKTLREIKLGECGCVACDIDAALAEPVEDEPVAIRFGSPMYACLDCGHCDDGLTLTWQDGESTKAMCVKCRQNRVENIEGSVPTLVRERDEARASHEYDRAEWDKTAERMETLMKGLVASRDEARAEVELLNKTLVDERAQFERLRQRESLIRKERREALAQAAEAWAETAKVRALLAWNNDQKDGIP